MHAIAGTLQAEKRHNTSAANPPFRTSRCLSRYPSFLHHQLRRLLSPCDSSPGSHYGESTAMGLCTSGRSDHRTCVYRKRGASIRPIASSVAPRLKLWPILDLHCNRPVASYSLVLVHLHDALAQWPLLRFCKLLSRCKVAVSVDSATPLSHAMANHTPCACVCHRGLRICNLCDLYGKHHQPEGAVFRVINNADG